jgi:molecular chaperone GrpE
MTTNHNDFKNSHNNHPGNPGTVNEQNPDNIDFDGVNDDINMDEAEAQSNDDAVNELSEAEQLQEQIEAHKAEVEKQKKEYMFLMAEFDNFRKRTLRERTELIKNAAEKVLLGILPILDDFERGLDAIKASDDADSVKEGMNLIYNKFVKYLNDNGVKVMETTGADFDADLHEAIAMVPADDTTPSGKIKDTVQKGYTLNDKVLRHAKVVVAQ